MPHAVLKESSGQGMWAFRNRLPWLLALMAILITPNFLRLPAEENSTEVTDDGARTTEPTTVWPRRTTIDGWTITVYQLQPERLDGNLLTARAAVSVMQEKSTQEQGVQDQSEPVFGAAWMAIRLDIDREQRRANASSLSIDRVQFPDGDAGDQAGAATKDRLQRALIPADLTFNLDDLIATLEQEPTDKSIYNIVPPHILIRTIPSELVTFDGPPRFETAGGVTLAVNTPAFVCVDGNGAWWLRLDSGWLTAPGDTGPWVLAPAPAAVAAAAEAAGLKANPAPPGDATAPAVIIATEPTDLVVFTGEPQWTPIADTGILAADNSDSDAFLDTTTRRYWLLLAGRWFSAERLADDASWVAVAPNALPAGFTAIPADSRWAHVRVHISGTEEARAAAQDAQVPQTARIPRSATITVTYDGEPRFTPIPASDVAWAENSSFAVFRTAGPQYWCCDQGVWYQAQEPAGPWTVATNIPDSLHRIPADNPNHNVTYVYVYDSGPDYVWTGYTSGYVHHYIYLGCPIYGSGWYWRGYYGHSGYYCPRPITWGVRVTFNPWYCAWGSGSGFRRGPVGGVAFVGGNVHSGWWGPAGRVPQPLPRAGRRPLPSDNWQANGAHQRPDRRDTVPGAIDGAIYRQVPGAQLPTRQPRQVHAVETRAVIRDPGEPVFVAGDGSLIRRNNSGTWQERHNRTWTDVATTAGRDAGRDQGATQRDQRLPRVATHPPVSEQQQQPRPARPQNNRPVEPPITQPQPPTDRPQQQPPRRQPQEPRPQQPNNRPNDPPTERPQPPADRPPRRPEEPRPQQPRDLPTDPPTNQPQPPTERPPQQPRRQPEEPRPHAPDNRPDDRPTNRPQPPAERPPQQPPRQPEEPRSQPPQNLPADPPTNRPQPPTDQPPQQPPRRRSEEPRPQAPDNRPNDPPVNRPQPPTERPPRRQSEESRPQVPDDRPAEPARDVPRPTPDSRPDRQPVVRVPPPQDQAPASRPAEQPAPRQQQADAPPQRDRDRQRDDRAQPREAPPRERDRRER